MKNRKVKKFNIKEFITGILTKYSDYIIMLFLILFILFYAHRIIVKSEQNNSKRVDIIVLTEKEKNTPIKYIVSNYDLNKVYLEREEEKIELVAQNCTFKKELIGQYLGLLIDKEMKKGKEVFSLRNNNYKEFFCNEEKYEKVVLDEFHF